MNEIGIINQAAGVIDANVSGYSLDLDPNAANGLTNQGLLRATNGGILGLSGSGGGGFDNTGGRIIAFDLSEVQFSGGAALTGGLVQTQGTGVIRVVNTASFSNLGVGGNFIANDNTTTTFAGTITNTGNITINSTSSYTDAYVGGVTLTGGGNFFLKNADRIRGSGTFTNVDNTIQGETSNSSSSFGLNEIGIVNQVAGVIDANVSGLGLDLDPNAAVGLTNQGILRASNGGILRLSGNGGGGFNNSGTIEARSGGAVQFQGAVVTSSGTVDVDSNTLAISGGGTYTQTAGTFRLAGGTVTSSSALNFQAGLIDARGTISAAIQNNAILRPALGGNGLNVTGNVSLLSASQLTFQIGGVTQGSQYGFLNVTGNVSLGGNLNVALVGNFQPSSATNFTVLSSTAPLSGAFANVANNGSLTTTDNSGSFTVSYNGNNLVLSGYQSAGLGGKPAAAIEIPAALTAANDGPPLTRSTSPTVSRFLAESRGEGNESADEKPAVVNVENSDQILALLEGAGPKKAKGKVVLDAKRVAKAVNAQGTPSDRATGGKSVGRTATPPRARPEVVRQTPGARRAD